MVVNGRKLSVRKEVIGGSTTPGVESFKVNALPREDHIVFRKTLVQDAGLGREVKLYARSHN
jgi:hypothetical protein